LFAAIFKFLPNVKLVWRHVWRGAVITAAGFTAGKYGLVLYFRYATPTSAFGAAGSLVGVLLWVYYSSFVLFFGAELTKVWALHRSGRAMELAGNPVAVSDISRTNRSDYPSDTRAGDANVNSSIV
jgi:membrane protein